MKTKNMKKIDFRDRKLLFIDLETTGLNPETHEIVEVGCLVVDGGTFDILEEYETKVRPEHIETAQPEALKINGYSELAWIDAKPLREVLTKLAMIAPGGMLVGWNISFDWDFLERGFRKKLGEDINTSFDYHRLDAMSIAYAMLHSDRAVSKLGLRPIASHFGIELPQTHGAMGDTKAMYEVFKILMSKHES